MDLSAAKSALEQAEQLLSQVQELLEAARAGQTQRVMIWHGLGVGRDNAAALAGSSYQLRLELSELERQAVVVEQAQQEGPAKPNIGKRYGGR